ncbi:hypothetical protein ACO1KF_09760 [Leptospira interrogans serovar Hardjo-prajitno]|uniref:hypothetical protein n=1 Tax=Leptospira interrogans TaxID=173 RepID=UPI0009E4E2D6
MFYGDFVSNFFSLDSILFALFDILTLFQGRLHMRQHRTFRRNLCRHREELHAVKESSKRVEGCQYCGCN